MTLSRTTAPTYLCCQDKSFLAIGKVSQRLLPPPPYSRSFVGAPGDAAGTGAEWAAPHCVTSHQGVVKTQHNAGAYSTKTYLCDLREVC